VPKPQDLAGLPDGLSPLRLRPECDPKTLGFETTASLKPRVGFIGQDRAIDAIKLSAEIAHKGFNLYVLGREGTGRHTAVSQLLSDAAAQRPVPCDWIYVNNFDAPHKPHALKIPAGSAATLKLAMQSLVDDLAIEIPALFEAEEYRAQRRAIDEEFGKKHEDPIIAFAARAEADDAALIRTQTGFMLSAIVDGKPIDPDTYEAMTPEEQTVIDEKIAAYEEQLMGVLSQAPQLEKEQRQRIEALHAAMAERAVSLRVREITAQFADNKRICIYLKQVRTDMISNADLFLFSSENAKVGPFPDVIRKHHQDPQFDRYAVNVMVSHGATAATAAPIIAEDLPSLGHLIGHIENYSEMGTLATNFTLIKPGALHLANGGYLVLDAQRVLSEPYAWDALKRCLQSQSIAITSLADRMSLASTITLEPDPIPLDVRVVLIGDRQMHTMLTLIDPEFTQLFKLQADFEDALPRTVKNTRALARVLARYATKSGLKPMTAAAVASLLDHAIRLADDNQKLTLELGALADVMCEADFYATQKKRKLISDKDVEQAIKQAEHRASRIKEQLKDAVIRKTILIDTSGDAIGQVNGLTVINSGTHYFGQPTRITAKARMGAGKLIDIEREVDLGGPLHSKGVLILSSYLASHFALDVPMSLHASLAFEQSYGGVDGDSASSAELYALLSALSGIPIRQGLAVTGSVNQNGEVQAIGAVNEKIEGFFDICVARGLTGDQGVLIPTANADNLMLRQDMVAACAKGAFRIIPIASIDQGIAALTGRTAGRRGRNGQFPNDSINGQVEAQLRAYATLRQRFALPYEEGLQNDCLTSAPHPQL